MFISSSFGALVLTIFIQAARSNRHLVRASSSIPTTIVTGSPSATTFAAMGRTDARLPLEPEKGTFIVQSNNIVTVTIAPWVVQMLLDLNSPCTWVANIEPQSFGEGPVSEMYTSGNSSSSCNATVSNNNVLPELKCDYSDHATTVQGQLHNTDLDMAGFLLANQSILVAQNLTSEFSIDDPILDYGNGLDYGVLGLGLPTPLLNANGNKLDAAPFIGPWSSILNLPPGQAPVPVMSLALPGVAETGRLVLGGIIRPRSIPRVGPTVNVVLRHDKIDEKTPNMTRVGVELIQTPQTNNWTLPNTFPQAPGFGWYLIDTMSSYIYTDEIAAAAVADMFDPPAGLSGDGVYVVDCDATLPSGKSADIVIGQTPFAIRASEMIVTSPLSNCTSAFQVTPSNSIGKLGWPFLRSVVLLFDFRDWTVNVTARSANSAPPSSLLPSPTAKTITSSLISSTSATMPKKPSSIRTTSLNADSSASSSISTPTQASNPPATVQTKNTIPCAWAAMCQVLRMGTCSC